MSNTYKTSEVANIIGIHPNTVRFYEDWGLISKPIRKQNGYRVFTDLHLEQCKLVRTALKVEVLQNGLRKKAIDIVKTTAAGDIKAALAKAESYLEQIKAEQDRAYEAIEIVRELLTGEKPEKAEQYLTRKQTADYLQITIDTLRNWELNGLLTVKRKQNGYRIYTNQDMKRLKIIRTLRCANYSLSAILRMLKQLSKEHQINIKKAINTPDENDDIVSACDKLLTSLKQAEENSRDIITRLNLIKKL